MKWVVLSDLHMDFKNCATKTARKELLLALRKEKDEGDVSFVLITGDCLHKNHGDAEESGKFIQEIGKSCGVDKDRIIICPGNHDIDRENIIRNNAIKEYRERGLIPKVDQCLVGYSNFRELYSLIYGVTYKPFFFREVDDFRVIEIDSCLLSKDDEDYGKLIVGFSDLADLSEIIPKDEKINIVMMHHGVEWLQADDGRRFQHWLVQNNVKMVFCGHNHAPGMSILTEGISENRLPMEGIPQFTCGCALADSYSNPVFMVGQYMDDGSLEIVLYEYRSNSQWEKASGLLRSFPNGCYQASSLDGMIRNSYDIPKIYNTIYDMGDDAEKEIRISTRLDFFGLRGGTFLKGNSKIANALYEKAGAVACRLLVSDPYSSNIGKRLRSVPEFSPQLELEKQWKTNYQDIKKLRDNFPAIPSWGLRFHEQPLLFRFIITDHYVYFGYYKREPSSMSPMYRYTNQSALYKSLRDYFDSAWENSATSFSPVVPDRCSFVLDRFMMKPSLVINLASRCNMNCQYCPEGGENLDECEELCDITQVKYLLISYADYYKENGWTEKKVVRITGGEPLLYPDRLLEILQCAKSEGYEKIILCTNGLSLKECYRKNPTLWESIKNILLLKISLDTMKAAIFKEMTGTDELRGVLDSIVFAKDKGFMVEINLVATKRNVGEIEKIYDYVYSMKLVGLKVLTINDFGRRVDVDDVELELNELIETMRHKNYAETGLYVHNNKGIHMKRFIHDGCTLTIVDHMNKKGSVTPRRTYSEECQFCEYYPDSYEVQYGINKPCATGIMSLTMRADGLLSFCRMKNDSETCLKGKTLEEIKEMVELQLKKFENCYHYEIGEKK